jgi:chemotaxis protein MotA
MDFLTIVGIAVAMTGIFYGHQLEGGDAIGVLSHPMSYLIILGGTLGATLTQTPLPHLIRTVKLTPWLIKPPANDYPAMIGEIVEWSQTARKEGLLALEDKLETVTDPFTRKGLQMLASAREPQAIRATLEAELDAIEELNMSASKFYEAAGAFAPTIGIIGAVMGLIMIMSDLTDPSKLGVGIAAAFVATIYGLMFANLFFLPMGVKLKVYIMAQSKYRELIIEGLLLIAGGENPRFIEEQLSSYVAE